MDLAAPPMLRLRPGRGRRPACWLLLHGFLGDPAAWEATAAALPAADAVWAACLPGHGGGGAAAVPPSYGAVVASLAAAWRACAAAAPAPQAVRLVGYSLGGRLALGLLRQHPALWHTVHVVGAHPGLAGAAPGAPPAAVAAAAAVPPLARAPTRAARRRLDRQWEARLTRGELAAFFAAWDAQPLFAGRQAAAPAAALRARRRWRRRLQPDALAAVLRATGLADMPAHWPWLRRAARPLHWLAGDADAKILSLATIAHGRGRRGGRLWVLPGCGHDAPLTAPGLLAACLAASAPPP